jgi:hypothetical protein
MPDATIRRCVNRTCSLHKPYQARRSGFIGLAWRRVRGHQRLEGGRHKSIRFGPPNTMQTENVRTNKERSYSQKVQRKS